MQLRNELATIRWRSNGDVVSCPVGHSCARYGGYLSGGAVYHSAVRRGHPVHPQRRDCGSCYPSNALDANGLLRTAIRCDDPVIFLEHKHLYRQVHNKGRYPGRDHMVPLGKPRSCDRERTSPWSLAAPS